VREISTATTSLQHEFSVIASPEERKNHLELHIYPGKNWTRKAWAAITPAVVAARDSQI